MKIWTSVEINKGEMYSSRGNQYIVTANGMEENCFWHEREPVAAAYRKLEKRLEDSVRDKDALIEALQYEIRRLRTSYPQSRIRELERELVNKCHIVNTIREALS